MKLRESTINATNKSIEYRKNRTSLLIKNDKKLPLTSDYATDWSKSSKDNSIISNISKIVKILVKIILLNIIVNFVIEWRMVRNDNM